MLAGFRTCLPARGQVSGQIVHGCARKAPIRDALTPGVDNLVDFMRVI